MRRVSSVQQFPLASVDEPSARGPTKEPPKHLFRAQRRTTISSDVAIAVAITVSINLTIPVHLDRTVPVHRSFPGRLPWVTLVAAEAAHPKQPRPKLPRAQPH